MTENLKNAIKQRIDSSDQYFREKRFEQAFQLLEEAHILSQAYPVPHTQTHLKMLRIGWVKKDLREIFGQLIRIPSGFIGSMFGLYPVGNPGGAKVSALKKFPIPSHLADLLDSKE